MDYDADGILDFISGSYDPGDLYLFRGLGKGEYAARELLRDENDVPLVHHPKDLVIYHDLKRAGKKKDTAGKQAVVSWGSPVKGATGNPPLRKWETESRRCLKSAPVFPA